MEYIWKILLCNHLDGIHCFTSAAATIFEVHMSKDTKKQLLITSIILGFIHLTFEICQMIYRPILGTYLVC